jgi:hypothetical protein
MGSSPPTRQGKQLDRQTESQEKRDQDPGRPVSWQQWRNEGETPSLHLMGPFDGTVRVF